MICLRCGYCCITSWVMIVDDPTKGVKDSNIIEKKTGDKCKHLKELSDGTYECAIHNYSWYKQTPCFSHGQIERSKQSPCRMGEYVRRTKWAAK